MFRNPPRTGSLRRSLALGLNLVASFGLAGPLCAATFTVTTAADSGAGSLRQAITSANGTLTKDTIQFNIGGGGVKTIQVLTALPVISQPLVIDGTTQPGSGGVPAIELNGSAVTGSGLAITSGNSEIRGLAINRFGGAAIRLLATGSNVISNNRIGTDLGGSVALGNRSGISIESGSNGNTIGLTDRGNLISGNTESGILIAAGSIGNVVQANRIGTNGAATAALPNGSSGVRVFGSNNTVGGNAGDLRNIISGNLYGVSVEGADASGNQIVGNWIGLNGTGTAAIPNERDGVAAGGSGTTIGGAGAARNVISGNGSNGISISTAALGTKIFNNYIGTNPAGSSAVGNVGFGIRVFGSGATIGIAGNGNVISGNAAGVSLEGGPSNTVGGNVIGLDATGTVKLPNLGSGVAVEMPGNLIGGLGNGNVIAGNANDGISVATTATGTVITANRIGTNQNNSITLGNQDYGIRSFGAETTIGGVDGTTPGGACTGVCNLVSGNGRGIILEATATQSVVQGNFIGTNLAGTSIVGHGGSGLDLRSSGNTIGGTTPNARNLIGGNEQGGLVIDADDNQIQGNWIGLDTTGNPGLGNGSYGIRLYGGSGNFIGGATDAERNVITSNERGIEVSGQDNDIQGNYIGTKADGTGAVGNNETGIDLLGDGNRIGGTAAGAGNVLAGDGILLEGSGNTIQGNTIGTDKNGLIAAGTLLGIRAIGAEDNLIGGTAAGAGNRIENQSFRGIGLEYGSTRNRVEGNTIQHNVGEGIAVFQAYGNTIGGTAAGAGNTIAANGTFGIYTDGGQGNAFLGNSMSENDLRGITLTDPGPTANDAQDPDFGANLRQNFPLVRSAVTSGGTTVLQGTLNSVPNTAFRIELFSSPACHPSGLGEGKTYLDFVNVTTDATGNATFTKNVPEPTGDTAITATATDPKNNTSEFSPCATIGGANPGQFVFSYADYVASEAAGQKTITVTRTGGVQGAVTVHYATQDDSATSPDDYTTASGTLQFADGEVLKSFTVPVQLDAEDEDNQEIVKLVLSAPTGGATLGSRSTAQLYIIDYDLGTPTVFFSDATVTEPAVGTAQATFTITLSPHSGTVQVGYTTADGTAKAGTDYQETIGTVTFAPNETTKTVSVPVLQDFQAEADEAFFLSVTTMPDGTVSDGLGEALILDAAAAPKVPVGSSWLLAALVLGVGLPLAGKRLRAGVKSLD